MTHKSSASDKIFYFYERGALLAVHIAPSEAVSKFDGRWHSTIWWNISCQETPWLLLLLHSPWTETKYVPVKHDLML